MLVHANEGKICITTTLISLLKHNHKSIIISSKNQRVEKMMFLCRLLLSFIIMNNWRDGICNCTFIKEYFKNNMARHFLQFSESLSNNPSLFYVTQIIYPFLNSRISANYDKESYNPLVYLWSSSVHESLLYLYIILYVG